MRVLLEDEAFNFLIEDSKSALATDESLKGLDLREDTYRKACMKDGIDYLVSRAQSMANPDIGK